MKLLLMHSKLPCKLTVFGIQVKTQKLVWMTIICDELNLVQLQYFEDSFILHVLPVLD